MSIFGLFVFLAVLVWVTLFAHELGHLLVARYFGVRVLIISIGMGPKLFRFFDRYGTCWSFSAIPIVSFTETINKEASPGGIGVAWAALDLESLTSCSIVQKAAIYGAGAAADVVLAPLIFAAAQLLFTGALAWPKQADAGSAMALTCGFYTLSIGLLNLLPFPPLDGGKLLQLGLDRFRRRRNPPHTVHAANSRARGWR
jgi:membrane-associated protease RseP (regulator of RpoE activity)